MNTEKWEQAKKDLAGDHEGMAFAALQHIDWLAYQLANETENRQKIQTALQDSKVELTKLRQMVSDRLGEAEEREGELEAEVDKAKAARAVYVERLEQEVTSGEYTVLYLRGIIDGLRGDMKQVNQLSPKKRGKK